jgi:prephenate dehydratase
MSKIYFQGTFGAYSHLAALSVDSDAEILPCKTFDECFNKASLEPECKIIIPESNRIENERGNLTRFLVMGKNISQPEFESKKYITSFLFKLKSKPAALYQSLSGFAINGVNLTKLQSYPEKNTFDSFFFLCDLDGHIEDPKVQKSLEELGLHCEDFHVLGVFEADKLREKKN